jgi:UDP-N-acetylmuramate dehydrogenase
MQIQNNVSLKDYSTMRLGGNAKALVTVTTKDELTEAINWAKQNNLPILILGGGSNVIFSKGYEGLVIVNRLQGFEVLNDDPQTVTIKVGAGENWDKVVERTVQKNLHGIEALSAIPGTAGATPVQNVGAYGAQISDVFVELEAYDTKTDSFIILKKEDCKFSYRHSIFKSLHDRHYVITSITLQLDRQVPKPPFYESLQKYLDEHQITNYTPQTIRSAVVAIRAVRLPDPSLMANTGSFFKNPIVISDVANKILTTFPAAPNWPMPDGKFKLGAGWLIEQAGLKGYKAHGMKTYENHALVLVNESAKSYDDLAAFRQEIIDKVHQKFGVTLEQEPELL